MSIKELTGIHSTNYLLKIKIETVDLFAVPWKSRLHVV
jgi:hypothetical protein